MLRHIVFFKLKEGLDESTVQKALSILENLRIGQEGINEWTVTESLDARKGRIIVENGQFLNAASLKKFRESDQHGIAAEFMKGIADWWVGDYEEKV